MFYDLYRMEIKTLRLISIISKVLCFQLNFWLLAYLLQSVLRWHLLILPLLFFHSNLRRIFHEKFDLIDDCITTKLYFFRNPCYSLSIFYLMDSGILKYKSLLFLCPLNAFYLFCFIIHFRFCRRKKFRSEIFCRSN